MMRIDSAHHPLTPPIISDTLRYFCPWPIVSIKGHGKILKILWSFRGGAFTYFIEHGYKNPFRIIFVLYHEWRDRTDQYRFYKPGLTVVFDISDHFGTTRGVAHVYSNFQIQCLS